MARLPEIDFLVSSQYITDAHRGTMMVMRAQYQGDGPAGLGCRHSLECGTPRVGRRTETIILTDSRLRWYDVAMVFRDKPAPSKIGGCAGREPSAGAVDRMPSTSGYGCTDRCAGHATYRRKALHEVRIGGGTAVKGRAFGTVSLDKIGG